MDRIKRVAVISNLADRLRKEGSWCGETHVQKAGYFLQALLDVPLGFDFVMYKHGPFSFDLRDELTSLRADGLLELQARTPYGPSYVTTELGKEIQGMFPRTLAEYENKLEFVADRLGRLTVLELEKLATALFVTLDRERHDGTEEGRAGELHRLKKHISELGALEAVRRLDRMVEELPA
ncbi:MAG: hypothetical protein OXI01_12640 [Albidovulum sp.]|nr:hypothetical protein [Albidovulum sp.]